jgi:hypothetical protein
MKYTSYKIYLHTPCCGSTVEVASLDYYCNAIERRNQLIETFGKYRITLKKITKE